MLSTAVRHILAFQNRFIYTPCRYTNVSRTLVTTASRSATSPTILPASVDDADIFMFFDQPKATHTPPSTFHTGLFGHSNLTTPPAFNALTDSTLRRAQLLTERILKAPESRVEMFKVVKNLDRLSNMLCRIIDLAELLRNAHPDSSWVEMAERVYEKMCEFMNVLNTHVGLYKVLQSVLSDQEIVASLSPEAHQTALIFWRDFERSGIQLSPHDRGRFVSLSTEILLLGRQFINESSGNRTPAVIKPSELQGLKDPGMGTRLRLQAQATQRELLVYPGSLQAQMIMCLAPLEEPRRKVYMASNTSSPEQIRVLERLLCARGELARLVGKESYAHMTLADKMAKTPENVQHFLGTLLDHTKPYARRALQTLSQRKQAHLNTPPFPTIQPWDRDFYCPPEPPTPPIPLPRLTPGTAYMALSRLFKHLYGVSLHLDNIAPGEVWHNDVRKLKVLDEHKGVLGWIYTDLFARRGKPGGAAHYTVCCSRRTDNDDEKGDYEHVEDHDVAFCQPSRDFEASPRMQPSTDNRSFQLPVVVLICEFARSTVGRPVALEWHEVLTLFHEMGHAMHSMIGRTEYQNVSGTRCATDFVELPSILMEHFLTSPVVLSLFDPNGRLAKEEALESSRDACRSIDTHTQILLAILDQLYHSPAALKTGFDSTEQLAALYRSRGLIPHVPGTSWQTQFGHLFGYGATYYSYLFDRAIASRVWRKIFSANPLDRTMGERYKEEVLQFGGGKDPWQMVSTLLANPMLQAGDTEAMAEVGRWKIEDDVTSPVGH